MKFLSYEMFEENAKKDRQWKSYKQRWLYHEKAIELLRKMNLPAESPVLEIGSFGANIVMGSDLMDMPLGEWPVPEETLKYVYDARQLPWPIADKQYDVLIALRVWHHLSPVQEQCFMEAKRVSQRILLVCPEQEMVGKGIAKSDFISWNGAPPLYMEDLGAWGVLYLF